MAGIYFARPLIGIAEEPGYATVGATAIKRGDPLIAGATANVVVPMTATNQKVRGVSEQACAVGGTVSYMRAMMWNVFLIPCSAAKKYVASADAFTYCDFDTFTSGAMSMDPATDTNHDVLMLGLADESPDDTVANIVQCTFSLRSWDHTEA